jgi:hypothetical protein
MANTIGMSVVAFFSVVTAPPYVTITSTFCAWISAAKLYYALRTSLRPVVLNLDRAVLDPTEFAKPLYKSKGPWSPIRLVNAQVRDGRHLAGLLRTGSERGSDCRAAQKRDKLAPSHGCPQKA